MRGLTEEGRRLVADVAQRHGVGVDAVQTLLMALAAGGGTQAQFSHPELGGMGQWSLGGMTMVGDMFNNGLKYRVDTLCGELSQAMRGSGLFAPMASSQSQSQSQSSGGGGAGVSLFVPGSYGNRWPAELGAPASAGSQNDLHYAVFPATRRLAIERGGQVTVYDTADHVIVGFSQQQGGDQSLTFTSQYGLVQVTDLAVVPPAAPAPAAPVMPQEPAFAPAPPPAPAPPTMPPPPPRTDADDDVFGKIERLAGLRQKDIITAEEFEAKKRELLSRL